MFRLITLITLLGLASGRAWAGSATDHEFQDPKTLQMMRAFATNQENAAEEQFSGVIKDFARRLIGVDAGGLPALFAELDRKTKKSPNLRTTVFARITELSGLPFEERKIAQQKYARHLGAASVMVQFAGSSAADLLQRAFDDQLPPKNSPAPTLRGIRAFPHR